MAAVCDELVLREETAQALLSLKERKVPQIFTGLEHYIENAVAEGGFRSQGVLQELEMRYAVPVERDQLSIEYGIHLYQLEDLRHGPIAIADDLSVARIKGNLAVVYAGDHAETIPLGLENPVRIVERRISECGQHGLE